MGRKVFVIPRADWLGHVTDAQKDALHARNIAALSRSLRENGIPFGTIVVAPAEDNADGASVNLNYDY